MLLKVNGKNPHGGNIWAVAQKWGMNPADVIDFSASINPLGPSPRAIAAIQAHLGMLDHYPEPEGESLRSLLADYLEVDSANLVLGNGGTELIYLLGRMLYQRRLLLLAPCFSEYEAGLENPRVHLVNLSREDDFKLPLARLLQEIEEQDLIFIANPNNPTGNLFARQELEVVIVEAAAKNATVVMDEAFLGFVGETGLSLADQVENYKNLVVIGSLTKFFALPALRLGYAVAHRECIMKMEALLPPWRINGPALAAASAAVRDREYITATYALLASEKAFLTAGLREIPGLKAYPAAANFILVDAEARDAPGLQERLRGWGILIRTCGDFRNLSPGFFRIAIKNRQANQALLQALRTVL